MPDLTGSQRPRLLDDVRNVLRLHHYSIHTERSYVDWIVRFVRFHRMRSPQGGGSTRRVDQADQRAYLSPFLRHPSPSARN
ncbi:MAG: phage integrase N-terminal SAM-like domain-containing protein [Nitrospirota bacterium]